MFWVLLANTQNYKIRLKKQNLLQKWNYTIQDFLFVRNIDFILITFEAWNTVRTFDLFINIHIRIHANVSVDNFKFSQSLLFSSSSHYVQFCNCFTVHRYSIYTIYYLYGSSALVLNFVCWIVKVHTLNYNALLLRIKMYSFIVANEL